MAALRIEALAARHQLEGFACGDDSLNRFLSRHALTSERAKGSRTWVALRDEHVVGFHTLVVGAVAPEQVPLMVLARLAVNRADQGHGLGAGLFKDAIF